jgi:hypothetical protein
LIPVAITAGLGLWSEPGPGGLAPTSDALARTRRGAKQNSALFNMTDLLFGRGVEKQRRPAPAPLGNINDW